MKYIYLDQNKWIELAKGLKNKDKNIISFHKTLVQNVKENVWAFPLSPIHINETMKRKDETSRNELLDLMFSLSNGYTICDYMTADSIEFTSWANNKFVDYCLLKDKIVRHDWVNIVGLSIENADINFGEHSIPPDKLDKIKQIIKEHCFDREVFDIVCNSFANKIEEDETFYYECYKDGRKKIFIMEK